MSQEYDQQAIAAINTALQAAALTGSVALDGLSALVLELAKAGVLPPEGVARVGEAVQRSIAGSGLPPQARDGLAEAMRQSFGRAISA